MTAQKIKTAQTEYQELEKTSQSWELQDVEATQIRDQEPKLLTLPKF